MADSNFDKRKAFCCLKERERERERERNNELKKEKRKKGEESREKKVGYSNEPVLISNCQK